MNLIPSYWMWLICLLCRTCVDQCPNKVKTDEVMMGARQHIADRQGGTKPKYKVLGKILRDRTLLITGALGLIN